MRWAQLQFHGTYKENAELLTSQAAAADVTGCRCFLQTAAASEPSENRTCVLYTEACVYVPSGYQSSAWDSKASARPPTREDWAGSVPLAPSYSHWVKAKVAHFTGLCPRFSRHFAVLAPHCQMQLPSLLW